MNATQPPAVRAVIAATLLAASGLAQANESLVDIKWSPGGGFEHSAALAPGKFLEVCGKLSKGQTVRWQFEASLELSFNIHYHQGKDVVYPAQLPKSAKAQDQLNVPVDQDYCWMWSNKGKSASSIKLQLQR